MAEDAITPAGDQTGGDQGLGLNIEKVELPREREGGDSEGGFLRFLLRGNVVDLAVAVIIGAAFVALVSAFVKDLLTPLIAAIGGHPDFSSLTFTIHNSRFQYGDFINALIAFVIVAAVLYYLVIVPMTMILRRTRRRQEAAAPLLQRCPQCFNSIPAGALRCGFCTSFITAGQPEPVAAFGDGGQ